MSKFWLVTKKTITERYPNPSELEEYESSLRSKSELKTTAHGSLEGARESYRMSSVSAGENGNSISGTIVQEYTDSNGNLQFTVFAPREGAEKTKNDYFLFSRFLEEKLNDKELSIDVDDVSVDLEKDVGAPGICNNCGKELPEQGDRKRNDNFILKTNEQDVVPLCWEFCDKSCLTEYFLSCLDIVEVRK